MEKTESHTEIFPFWNCFNNFLLKEQMLCEMDFAIHEVHRKQFPIVRDIAIVKIPNTIKDVNIFGIVCLHIIIDTTMQSTGNVCGFFFAIGKFHGNISFPSCVLFPFATWIIITTIKSCDKGDEKDYVFHWINATFALNCGCSDFWLANLHFYSPFVNLVSFKLVISFFQFLLLFFYFRF